MKPDPIALCEAGHISPETALAQLLLAGFKAADIAPLLRPGSELGQLFQQHRRNLDIVANMLDGARVNHDRAQDVQAIATMFDRAVAAAPEASVAAYALNDPALLARATRELVEWLLAGNFVRAGDRVLDLGCGIGRVAAALAPHAGLVLGIDVSAGMIAEAQRRHGNVANLRFSVTDGQPPDLPAGSLDVVLAVDSFPYLVEAGIAGLHASFAARVLRPGGVLAIFNLSYSADAGADSARLHTWADEFGFTIEVCGERPFRLWDGRAYVLRR